MPEWENNLWPLESSYHWKFNWLHSIHSSQPYLWTEISSKMYICCVWESVCCTHPPRKHSLCYQCHWWYSSPAWYGFSKAIQIKRNQLTEIDNFVNVSPITRPIQHPSNGVHQRVHCSYQSKAQPISSNNKFYKNEPHGHEVDAHQQMKVIKR